MKKLYGFLVLLPFLSSAQLFITEVYRDTPYSEYIDFNDPANQNPTPALNDRLRKRHRGEFIEIYNASNADLNLKDWRLQDDEGNYDFPDKVIPSGQYVVVAANNNSTGDYFPTFFSTTQGKDSQILYQRDIKLNNSKESLRLIAKKVQGYDIQYTTSSFDYQMSNNFGVAAGYNSVLDPSIFYTVKDWQYGFDTPQTPTPLAGSITPPIKSIEDYINPYLLQNYDIVSWDQDVDNLTAAVCNIPINTVSQPQVTTTTSGGKSFIYDDAGNSSASGTYNPGSNPGTSNGFTADELDQIKMAIQLSPNPTYDIVNVNITGIAQGKVSTVQVFSGTGALLFTKNNLQNSSNYIFSFSLSGQITGVYVANFTLTTGQVVGKNILKY